MQDKFVGDVGDFGKYGLLRALTSPPQPDGERDLSLGMVWYLVPDNQHSGAGKYITYLDNPGLFRPCDPRLFDALKDIVDGKRRRVSSIRDSQIFLPRTVFYEARLTFEGIPIGNRLAHRKEWVRSAVAAAAGCDLVFVDPDNGLEVRTPPHHKHGLKYVFFDEVSPYIHRDQTLIIYQHMNHRKPVNDQISERITEITRRLQAPVLCTLVFRRWNLRAFFVIPNRRDRELLSRRVDGFLSGAWDEHFQLIR